ncbi:MAG: response regulator, partial [Cyanobacteria bacterium REEB65]|nr:response regulator [Cyanobacteria bacterium REEB65]
AEERGWQVVGEAANGKEAVESYQALQPDVVTMDITMPEMDGIAAVKAIVALDPKARIVMCTALGQQDMVVEAVRSGAKDFIVKPFKKERVFAAVEGVLAK